MSPDAQCLLIEAQASPEDISCREDAANDDLTCFITYTGLEDDAVLGLGLFVHPLSARQTRYGLVPDFDLVFDYLDVEAFNQGVQHAKPSASETGELRCMVSSARKRLNGWLPLYLNATHWSRTRCFVQSAFAYLATGKINSQFQTNHALDVCCSLLSCIVSGFTVGQAECASPRTSARGKANEKAMQMYADVHRLFLQVAQEYPEMRQLALQRLRSFIQDPAARTRDQTPSLGSLVQCLLVTEELSWEDLAPSFIPEALRRHAVRQVAWGETMDLSNCKGSVDKLISEWDRFAPRAACMTCFSVLFYHRVGRPNRCSLKEVAAAYDRRWGRLQSDVVQEMMAACAHLSQCHSIENIIAEILPHGSCTRDKLGDMILWAERHGRPSCRGVIIESKWPQFQGPNKLLRQWRHCRHRQTLQRSWHYGDQTHQYYNEESSITYDDQFYWSRLDNVYQAHMQPFYIQDYQYHPLAHHTYDNHASAQWSWHHVRVAAR